MKNIIYRYKYKNLRNNKIKLLNNFRLHILQWIQKKIFLSLENMFKRIIKDNNLHSSIVQIKLRILNIKNI